MFPHTVSVFPESERHYPRYDGQVPRWSEAARGKVALVLDGLVAPGRGHVLRHGGGCAGELVAEEVYRWLRDPIGVVEGGRSCGGGDAGELGVGGEVRMMRGRDD